MYFVAKGYHYNNLGLIGRYSQETNCEIIIIIMIIIIIIIISACGLTGSTVAMIYSFSFSHLC
jgi:hypothetical protein